MRYKTHPLCPVEDACLLCVLLLPLGMGVVAKAQDVAVMHFNVDLILEGTDE